MAAAFPGDAGAASFERLEETFDATAPLTVGLEEEVMLLDPQSLDLKPCAADLLGRLDGDARFKPELPASQVEIVTEPLAGAREAVTALARGRRDLAEAARGLALPAGIGVHPFAAAEGELAAGERYQQTEARYGRIARHQLVAALQVHVAVGGSERTLAVYNALRGYLPEIAALAANAPHYRGEDTGLASVRPKIAELLPRQGVPPAIASWERFAAGLRWGAAAGALSEPGLWWWELRPHPVFGTLEVRVPDAQATVADAAGIIAAVQAVVAWLASRHDDGEAPAPVETWRIEENRWLAIRDGVEGEMADLETGEREPTRTRLHRLLDSVEPFAERLGAGALLGHARGLVEANGAIRRREVARSEGVRRMTAELAERFPEDDAGKEEER